MKEDSIGLFGVMPKPPSLKLMARRLSYWIQTSKNYP